MQCTCVIAASKYQQTIVKHVSVYAKSHFHVHEVKCHRNHVLASLIVIDVCAGHFCTGGHNRKQRNLLHLQVTCRQSAEMSKLKESKTFWKVEEGMKYCRNFTDMVRK